MRRFSHHLSYLATVFLVVACGGSEDSAHGDTAKGKEQAKHEVVEIVENAPPNPNPPIVEAVPAVVEVPVPVPVPVLPVNPYFGYPGGGGGHRPRPVLRDFGDAPESYGTTLADDGANHLIPAFSPANNTAPLMLGDSIDAEEDGIPTDIANGDDLANIDDETGVAIGINVLGGQALTVPVGVTNSGSEVATLVGWIDFNRNGVFEASERATAPVPIDTTPAIPIPLVFPANSTVVTGTSFARFRLFPGDSTVNPSPSPTGSAMAGEVEDYPVEQTAALDFGDAPDTYGTLLASNGARHAVPGLSGILAPLRLGLSTDVELDAQAPLDSSGDNVSNLNDENGVLLPIFVNNTGATTVTVIVTNDSLDPATLAGWIDFNINGIFEASERVFVEVPAGANLTPTDLVFPINASIVAGTSYARIRLFPGGLAVNPSPSPTGLATAGEVEDYTAVQTVLLDFGDGLPASFGTASHSPINLVGVTADLMLGPSIDVEVATPPLDVTDESINNFDENGVTLPFNVPSTGPIVVNINATNNTGAPATAILWIDFDGDLVFEATEFGSVTVPVGVNPALPLIFATPPAFTGAVTRARLRLQPGPLGVPSPTGFIAGGEIEDYLVTVVTVIPLQ